MLAHAIKRVVADAVEDLNRSRKESIRLSLKIWRVRLYSFRI